MATEAEIEAKKTPNGGWTKAQLAEWGVGWPPPKGWRKKLIAESRQAELDEGRETGLGRTVDRKPTEPADSDGPPSTEQEKP